MSTPDNDLTSRIVDRLRKTGLLSDGALEKVQVGVAAGTLSSEDWQLIVELELSEKKGASSVEDK